MPWISKVSCNKFYAAIFILIMQSSLANSAQIGCKCIASSGGCQLKIYDDAAENPRQEWIQDYYKSPGRNHSDEELALACWRKRDVPNLGDGLCCSILQNEEDAKRFFSGKLRK
ncbi:hypothetical protein [Methylobacterium sp. WL8]|uniref:hypothetical protein n=1 Tax=Methylobacterium sp. WL8 TaxID=2603899 RepID=UPI0011CBABBA|nr:hypothetical protein [Methylobacterium sp. WL8]TXN76875.1 hypothetical protein FV234_24335 [Methylobacterium sp. WL8]